MRESNVSISSAVLAGIQGTFGRKRVHDITKNDVRGKHCIVTGATSGLGKAIATRFAAMGAEVTMAVRSMDEKAKTAIIQASANKKVYLEKLDLSIFQSVLDFVDRLQEKNRTCSILVLNAGVVKKRGIVTADGLDEMTQVNFLSNLLLVEKMLEKNLIVKNKSFSPRIVAVLSEAHRWSKGLLLEKLGEPHRFGIKHSMTMYADTKFMMAGYMAQLSRRLCTRPPGEQLQTGLSDKQIIRNCPDCVAVHSICPGAVNTNIAREVPAALQPLLKVIFHLFFSTPLKASRPVVNLAVSKAIDRQTGLYYHMDRKKAYDPKAENEEFGQALYKRAVEVINRAYGENILTNHPWVLSEFSEITE